MYKIEFDKKVDKQIKKLDSKVKKQILDYLEFRVLKDPFAFGKSLVADKSGLWRYRVNNYRVICDIKKDKLVVLVVKVGHRSIVYNK